MKTKSSYSSDYVDFEVFSLETSGAIANATDKAVQPIPNSTPLLP